MDTSSKEAKTKDFSTFEQALGQLHDNLLKDYVDDGHSIVIAMSRKGPRLVEAVFIQEELSKLNVVTEFAIPFIFKKMEQGVTYRIYVVDDAVYYGSTLKNLIKEIREYEQIYGLTLEVKAYVAIVDKEALPFNEIEVIGMLGPRNGYGHYFVQQVMSLFRSKKRCMEVEFPTITYVLDKTADLIILEEELKKSFGEVYRTSYKEEDVLNVLLKKEGSQFSKIRMYREGTMLHLTFMSPFNLCIGTVFFDELFKSMGTAYHDWWCNLLANIVDSQEKANLSDSLRRNMEKSLVVMANYIYSFQGFIYHRQEIERLLGRRGYLILSHGIQSRDLYKLIGVRKLADDLAILLSYYDRLVDFRFPNWNSSSVISEHQIYEEYDSPTPSERDSLAEHNLHMVRNSQNLHQALSAIVFNQNLFVERWSRKGNEGPIRHLWFGYKHDSLAELVKRYARFDEPKSLEQDIHEWLDRRIDMGCVVPQYIKDGESKTWVRVFRPGENEDVLLSHLSRFVIHVYSQIEEQFHLGYCPVETLGKVLSIVWRQFGDEFLQSQFCFKLFVSDGELYIDQEILPQALTVIRYLQKMYIFEVSNDGEVKISSRIADPDFLHYTTLDSKYEKEIDDFVEKMFVEMKDWGVNVYSSYNYFNHYLNRDVTTGKLMEVSKDSARQLKKVIENIEVELNIHPESPLTDEQKEIVFDVFQHIRKYDEHPNFYIKAGMTSDEYWHQYRTIPRVRVQHDFKAMYQVINLIVGVYMVGVERTMAYLKGSLVKNAMTMLRMDSLRAYIEKIEESGDLKDLRYGTTMPGLIKGILDRIMQS